MFSFYRLLVYPVLFCLFLPSPPLCSCVLFIAGRNVPACTPSSSPPRHPALSQQQQQQQQQHTKKKKLALRSKPVALLQSPARNGERREQLPLSASNKATARARESYTQGEETPDRSFCRAAAPLPGLDWLALRRQKVRGSLR